MDFGRIQLATVSMAETESDAVDLGSDRRRRCRQWLMIFLVFLRAMVFPVDMSV